MEEGAASLCLLDAPMEYVMFAALGTDCELMECTHEDGDGTATERLYVIRVVVYLDPLMVIRA